MAVSSLTITFTALGEGAESVRIELDDERNNGITNFLYGTQAFFLVFLDDTKYNYSLYATDGTITNYGTRMVQRTFDFKFIDNNTEQSNYPITSVDSYVWYGNSLGEISKVNLFEIAPATQPNPLTGQIGIGEVTITTQGHSHAISVLEKEYDEYPVVVIVYTTPI